MISLLTTTVLLSLSSLVCYQTNSIDNFVRLAGRASIFVTFAARSVIIYFGKDQGITLRRTRRLDNVSGWRTSFRRTIFVIQTKIRYCGPTITHKVSFWRLKLSRLLGTFFFSKENPLLWTYHYAQSFFLAPKITTIIRNFFFSK